MRCGRADPTPCGVVERDQNPQRDSKREEQQAGDFTEFPGKPVAQELEHLERAHEIPLGMNTERGRRERIGLFA